MRSEIRRVAAPRVDPAKIVLEYRVGPATVTVTSDGRYLVTEPEVTDSVRDAYWGVLEAILYDGDIAWGALGTPDGLRGCIRKLARKTGLPEGERSVLEYYLLRDLVGYSLIEVPTRDPDVEEIVCASKDAPVHVVHRSVSGWLETNIKFSSEEELRTFLKRVATRYGRALSTARPLDDFVTEEGFRLAATLGREVTPMGSSFTIRKFTTEPITITYLVAQDVLTPLMVAYYWLLLESKSFFLIAGPMASGKTTMLNALLTLIPPKSRVVTVEDTPEIRLPHRLWTRMVTRRGAWYTSPELEVDLFDLVKAALRHRADYIVVGEVRGREVRALVQAAALGHGSACTFHAEDINSILVRLTSPPLSVGKSFLTLISSVMFLSSEGGERRVRETYEMEARGGSVAPKKVFSWDPAKMAHEPSSAEELLKVSERLEVVARSRGWSEETLLWELRRREEFIKALLSEGVLSYTGFVRAVAKFYGEGG